MQVKPRAIDHSDNVIDIRKARNANELITVIGRINTAFRLHQGSHTLVKNKVSMNAVDKAYESLSWVLQAQEELVAAHTVAMHLNDTKRDRCVNAIVNLNLEVLELKSTLMRRIDAAAQPYVSDKLVRFSNYVHDQLNKISGSLHSISMHNGDYTYVAITARDVQIKDQYTSPEVCIKLREHSGLIEVSSPYSAFVETDRTAVASLKDLGMFMSGVLSYDLSEIPKISKSKMLGLDGVKEVTLSNTLNLHLDSAVTAAEINAVLRKVIPALKKSLDVGQFEVIHRLIRGDTLTLEFGISERKITDPKAFSRLQRLLSLSKSQSAQLASLMEPV